MKGPQQPILTPLSSTRRTKSHWEDLRSVKGQWEERIDEEPRKLISWTWMDRMWTIEQT